MEYISDTDAIKIAEVIKTLGDILKASEHAGEEVKQFIEPFKQQLTTNIIFADMLSRLDKGL